MPNHEDLYQLAVDKGQCVCRRVYDTAQERYVPKAEDREEG